jgi:hypothetical protein
MRRMTLMAACLIFGVVIPESQTRLFAQEESTIRRQLKLSPQPAKDAAAIYHLLPSEEEQEPGNAVPVLLRIIQEQQPFMKDVYPKLNEYAEMDVADPKLHELRYDSFAKQIIRAGSMSFADWEYPLRSDRPGLILLPDLQSQRQLVVRGMTAWIKQRLSKEETTEALHGIQAQLGVGRHCAATPIIICHLVGLSIANSAFDNLELAIQVDDMPNMYWALAALPPTLQDLGPTVRWELWATSTRLNEPLPAVGDESWTVIAHRFVEHFAELSSERYSDEEAKAIMSNIERLAKEALPKSLGFTEAEIQQMSSEERVMRWIYLQYCRLRTQIEPLTYQSPQQILAVKNMVELESKELLAATGAKSSPYPMVLPQGILSCRNFERRVKFLQTIESLRHHASKRTGGFPASLDELELQAPDDPFTGKPFIYESDGKIARLRQDEIEGLTKGMFSQKVYNYELTTK